MNQTTTTGVTEGGFFGHPRGLATLFFTEFWERFSYYGMRALLVLFMTAEVSRHGMGMDTQKASAIYGLYTFGVYVLALPGGWIADRVLGQRKAVLYGGIIIALGHYTMAIPQSMTFYLGMFLIVIGTGLLKPNVSSVVGDLYPEGGARRDAGFSIFYMGINFGALLGPLICGWLGEEVNWHYGFGAAGIGMTAGLIQYVMGARHLGDAGHLKGDAAMPEAVARARRQLVVGLVSVVALSAAFVGLASTGIIGITLIGFAQSTGVIVMILAIVYFLYIAFFACHDKVERQRIGVIFLLFLGAAMFWSGFEQAGSSMNLFAEDLTNRVIFGWEMPTTFLQSVNPFFIILLAPVIGGLWVKMGASNPSIPVKFGMGLLLLGAGFFVMAWGSQFIGTDGDRTLVSPMWLVTTYFLHTVGELCLSPIGLSSITKLAPERLVSQMMGTWFVGAAIGNLIAGLVAGYIDELPHDQLFTAVALIVIGTGLIFLLLAKPIGKMTHGIK
ncbi:MFS transporter [bacterium]|nr:MAG: MFS transporter [bacterium]